MFKNKNLALARLTFAVLLLPALSKSQDVLPIKIRIDAAHPLQTIEGFGASDAWTCQYAGLWPEEKKKKMADLLFSNDFDAKGNPVGIGLNLWRFSIGAGSAEQGAESGIRDKSRRQASFLKLNGSYDEQAMPGQMWFMNAAKARGVKKFLGFVNSPHVNFSLNGKAFSSDGKTNLDFSKKNAFAQDLLKTIQIIKKQTGITLDYLSPVNEPQWKWDEGKQEGCPYTNAEIAELVRTLSPVLKNGGLNTKIQIADAGQLDYLTDHKDTPKSQQISYFFDAKSPGYLAELPNLDRSISGHSYFTTSPEDRSIQIRTKVANEVEKAGNLRFWMSEYCVLGDGLLKGEGRDTGMTTALFIAKLMHHDFSYANATSWQWWLAVSAGDYKDGLVYLDRDKNHDKNDGTVVESKMLWAMGNYSRFIPEGSRRLPVKIENIDQVYASSYSHAGKIITVIVNTRKEALSLEIDGISKKQRKIKTYTTSSGQSLRSATVNSNSIKILPKSITTLLSDEH
ncbi:glycoside hydrolase [Pedobacter caeni]|uniref:O-Glycosyl hydrolase n=1 Tax=Pedobacter caeni TaxID=288992 RepID=A0A1M4THE6_9SPHI|nr:glycoside hydrolase [Pedobacter caeni]SHE43754.1 O-Glycosyl hydrolase [Pedobacter caeni]